MSAQLRDYYVTFHREEYVRDRAADWRQSSGTAQSVDFNIVRFVEDTLTALLTKRKGKLQIKFFELENEQDAPAYVTIDPLTLHIDQETWDLAKLGEPFSRLVIAHEIGHIVLHGHYEKAAFSNDPKVRFKAFPQENSAEWQADTFAGYFLLPDNLVAAFNSPAEIAAACSVPLDLARKRFMEVRELMLRKRHDRDFCSVCGEVQCTEAH